MLAIGWVITSPDAQAFLADEPLAFGAALFSVGLIWLVHVLVLLGAHKASLRLVRTLEEVHNLGSEYTFYYKITPTKVGGSLALNSILFAVLFILIYALRF